MTEHFFGRRKGRGINRGEPEKLESPEDIELAAQRESLFDRRSRRKTREDEAKFRLLERTIWLAVGVSAAVSMVFIAFRHPSIATGGMGGIGIAGGVWAVWRQHAHQDEGGPRLHRDR